MLLFNRRKTNSPVKPERVILEIQKRFGEKFSLSDISSFVNSDFEKKPTSWSTSEANAIVNFVNKHTIVTKAKPYNPSYIPEGQDDFADFVNNQLLKTEEDEAKKQRMPEIVYYARSTGKRVSEVIIQHIFRSKSMEKAFMRAKIQIRVMGLKQAMIDASIVLINQEGCGEQQELWEELSSVLQEINEKYFVYTKPMIDAYENNHLDFLNRYGLELPKNVCRKCGSIGEHSKHLHNRYLYADDFGYDAGDAGTTGIIDTTKAELIDGLKCVNQSCSHSWVPD